MINSKKSISKIILLFSGLLFFCYSNANDKNKIGNTQHQSPRNIKNINREWKFQLGDYSDAKEVKFDDKNWQNVGLPHTFSLPYFLSPDFYTGYGWYRKNIMIPNYNANRCYSLEFEGVFQVAEIFVNGKAVGKHRGGYTGFSIDITSAVKVGNNIISVRVNNIWDAQLAPRAGEHVFSGGIYRDVYLVETSPVHVVWYGTFVTTPVLSDAMTTVNIKTEIKNETQQLAKGIISTLIVDDKGKYVTELESVFSAEKGNITTIEQTSASIPNPKLWSPATPNLYKAITYLKINNKIVDQYETTFGMRWIEWTADKGFFLNGKHHYFKGANVHQDRAGWGDAVTNQGFVRDIRLMKEAGFDFIRGSHYPHDPAFSVACDKEGMLLWSENCFWGIGGFKDEGDWSSSAYPTIEKDEVPFEASLKESLSEMIRIHRNHPSIIVWSMSNEPFFSAPDKMPKVRKLLKDLVSLSHQLDPTRPAAIGGCQRGEIDTIGDVAGYNGDGAKLFLNPKVPSLVSEYGSTIADRPGDYIPGWGELQEEQYSWRSGQAIWCGFDHGSIAGHFGCMGIVDYFRLPKQQWYWYRNAYRGISPEKIPEPGISAKIVLSADKKVIQNADGTDDIHLIISMVDKNGKPVSNSPDVLLEVVSGPGEFPSGSSILFQENSDIAIRAGKAAIEFRSYYAGTTIIKASSKGLKPALITLVSKNAPAFSIKNANPNVRPYKRFINNVIANNSEINILAGRPTKVSSSAPQNSQVFINDGNRDTYWKSANTSHGATWCQIDMENIYSLSRINLVFKQQSTAAYQIQTSLNGIDWQMLVNKSDEKTQIIEATETISTENKGRFLRINFSNNNVNVAEIEAYVKQ
jgi:hypothetical protein